MLTSSLLLLLAPLSALARPTLSSRQSPNIRSIYQFTNFNAENLAPRSNGHLLITGSNQPYLADLDPTASTVNPTFLPPLSGVNSVLGIAETSSDVFAVAAGNFSDEGSAVPGSFGVWSVSMRTSPATVRLVTRIPDAQLLNGAAPLVGNSGTVLIADSLKGAIWKVNVGTGDYSVAIQDDILAPPSSSPSPFAFGVNGLRADAASVYFTNSAKGTYGRFPINSDGTNSGDAVIIANAESGTFDDFDRNTSGTAYIATHPEGTDPGFLTVVTSAGAQSTIVGGDDIFVQPTSARFGRGGQSSTLYVVSSGDGTVSGQVAAVSGL